MSSSEGLVFSSELVSGLPVDSLSGLGHGLDLYPTLTEGGLGCFGPELGALFDGEIWGTQHKGFLESVSNVPFSSSEVLNDVGTFPEAAVTVGGIFQGFRVSYRDTMIPESPLPTTSSQYFARAGDKVGQQSVGGKKNLANRGTQCARDRVDLESLVFGEDIDMDRVVEFFEMVVVGREREKRLGVVFLRSWVENTWEENVTWGEYQTSSEGLVCFSFLCHR